MAIDLLDLISKNAASVGLGSDFTGLFLPEQAAAPQTQISEGQSTPSDPTRSYENLTAGQMLGIAGPVLQSMLGLALGGAPIGMAKAAFQTAAQAQEDPYAAPGAIGQFLDSWMNDFGPVNYGAIFQDPTLAPSPDIVSTSPYAYALGISPEDMEAGTQFGMGSIAYNDQGIAYSTAPGSNLTAEQLANLQETLFGGDSGGSDGWGGLGDIGSGGDFSGADDAGYGGESGYGDSDSDSDGDTGGEI